MRFQHLVILLLSAYGVTLFPTAVAQAPYAVFDKQHREFFARYCVECHSAAKQEGQIKLDGLSFTIDSVQQADLWQKILNQLNSGEMPPEEATQPDREAKTEFLDALARMLVTARQSLSDGGGRITMRRLNRREYKNTIRDLLGVEVNARELPADGGAGNFDTVGSSLFMSSDQIEQYLALGRQAIDESIARYTPSKSSRRMHIEVEDKNAKIAQAFETRKDAHERYLKWTAAVDAAAKKPENAATLAQINAEKRGDTHRYFQWQKLNAPSPVDFGFVDAVHADEQGRRDWEHYVPYHRTYLEQPGIKTGTYLTIEDVHVNPYQPFRLPGDWPAGDYVVRIRIAASSEVSAERRFIEFGSQHDSGVRAVATSHQITGTMDQPQVLEIPLKFSPANGRGFFIQEKGSYESEDAARHLYSEAKHRNGIGPEFAIWVDWIEVEASDSPRVYKERREVELHANKMVGGTYHGYFKGGYTVAKAYLDSDRSKPPTAFGEGIADEQEAEFRVKAFEQHGPSFERYLDDPLTQSGSYLTIYNVHPEEVITLPPDQPSGWLKTKHEIDVAPPGEYTLRFRVGMVPGTPPERHFIVLGSRKEAEDFSLLQTFQITGTIAQPQVIEVPITITADGPKTFVIREKRDIKLDHEIYQASQKATGVGPVSALWIDWVEWEGPLAASPLETDHSLLTTDRQDTSSARTLLQRFAQRAFRDQAPGPEFIQKLVGLYEIRRLAGDSFEQALKEPLSVILASPHFLYLAEPTSEIKSRTITQRELATRLAYFLWSAPPDETLLELARSGKLNDRQVLAQQVDRMLDSEKSREFVQGFVHQWLSLDRLDFFQFNTQLYRDFDESTKAAARTEVYRSFEYMLRENRPLGEWLKSDYVIINGLLAAYYGIEDVTGDEYRRVSLPENSPRGGLLGMAAIMAMGSNGE